MPNQIAIYPSAGNIIPLIVNGNGATQALSSTQYNSVAGPLSGVSSNTSRQMSFPRSGSIGNLTICLLGSQSATGSMVFTYQVGTLGSGLSSTTQTVTIPAGSPVGTYSTTGASFSYSAGQAVQIQIVNNATVAGALIGSIYAELTGVH